MSNSEKVIKQVRLKADYGNTFNISATPIGTDQKYVGPLRNSIINNLEEQYIIGTSTYTEKYKDSSGNNVMVKSFYEDNSESYYRLTTTIYNSKNTANNDYRVVDNTFKSLCKNNDIDNNTHTDVNSNGVFQCYNISPETTYEFEIDEKSGVLKIYPITFSTIADEKLEYISQFDKNVPIPVATKKTESRIGIKDTELIRERVTNTLAKGNSN